MGRLEEKGDGEVTLTPWHMHSVDTARLQDWIGRRQQAADEVSLPGVQRIAALLDFPPGRWKRGDPLPRGWYVMLFAPAERQSGLGPDGHPAKGQFLPPIPLPRRMFAGRRVWFHDTLRVGDEVSRVSRIERIEPKQGRSGEMCFVTVRHEISGPRGLVVIEEQDLVYREDPKPGESAPDAARDAAPGKPPNAVETPDWTRSVVADPVMLFRYSAITFNAHRIHYDTAYARDTESYPDRVVNGGLTTLLLWQLAEDKLGAEIKSSASRNVKALFVNRPITLAGRRLPEANKARMWAEDAGGNLAIEAALELEAH